MTDLESLTLDDLRSLRKRIDQAIASFQERKRREAITAAGEVAHQHGFSLLDLTGSKSSRNRHSGEPTPGQPRYVNPNNREQTWSGRGRRPAWVADHLDAGGSLEDMAI